MEKDDYEMLKDLYNACSKYEYERQGLMSWELPSLQRAKKILATYYKDHNFNNKGQLIYGNRQVKK